MNGYVDSSVLLRLLLNQPGALSDFRQVKRPFASKLLKTECLRTLDRSRQAGLLTEQEHVVALKELHESLDSMEWIEVSDQVLDRAGGSFPVALGTLDAVHLSSALLWREQTGVDCVFLTHDTLLQKAASASGFRVLG